MGGCSLGNCFICGGSVDEDDWDFISDDADFNVLVHESCFKRIPDRIDGLHAKIELLKALREIKDKQEGESK